MCCMDKRTNIIAGAERIFENQGFRGIGVDGILAPSGTSTRTLYKHFGSREGLVLAVVAERHRSFMERLRDWPEAHDPIGSLFDVLESWLSEHGARGCMLLRAHSEYAGSHPDIASLVRQQKREFADEIARRVETALGQPNNEIALSIWLLFEGATAAASVTDKPVVQSAKRAALTLLSDR
ncbi:DNA-binding transcriptional regulator, AcrR family [Devosia crocina]|uniref:DNA-binding transcriptional regulator, AcrR family n=2 Tax=Devosia crocina TaxID=429728 RepID=A0A1I7N1Y2_9HYPH|nr:DNA-binding transcriptional regulator, AcrR family [Devosia crocina]